MLLVLNERMKIKFVHAKFLCPKIFFFVNDTNIFLNKNWIAKNKKTKMNRYTQKQKTK